MQPLRIFISSPGDVSKERKDAKLVIEQLRRRYTRKFILTPVVWEDLPLEPDMSFQQGIDLFLEKPGVDIGVFILWSRLGSPLGAAIPKADGSQYRSGTEREYDLMIRARRQSEETEGKARPKMIVYTREDDTSFAARLRGKTTAQQKDMIHQKELAESFILETFRDNETGENIGAYHSFERPTTFAEHLRTHLQAFLDELAGSAGDIIWDVERQGPPFLGLDAFQPEHADVFFGREEEILRARSALKENAASGCAFLLLFGASGSGKSSLARAGVLPEVLAHEPNEQAEHWESLIISPAELGSNPILALLTRLADPLLLPELNDQVPLFEAHADDLASNAERFFQYSFPKAIEAAASRLGGKVRFVIVIDQLEELFTKDALSKESRSAFLALVETLARSGHFWVIATARSDFYQDIQSEPALVRMKEGRGLLDVLPPKPDAIARLIEEPARLAGLNFEERDGQKLSSRILSDAAYHSELLPLLEFVLLELFNKADGNLLTHAAYDDLGGVEGALRRKAESTYNELPEHAAETLGQVLQALVTLGDESDTGGEMDKPVRLRALITTFTENGPARKLIEAFIAARLFTISQADGSTEATFTVAHESLLRVWPRAVAWKNQNSDFLRARARIAARMKDGSPLLDGDPILATIKAFLVTRRDGFSASQTIWIQQSIETAEAKIKQATSRRRFAFAALSILTLFSILAAVWAARSAKEAVNQRQEAEAGFEAARSSTDDFLSRIASEELSYILGIQQLREEMADKAIAQYQTLLSRKPRDLNLHLALGRARLARASILGQIGTLQEATAAFDETIRDVESLEKSQKHQALRMLLAKCHIEYSRFRFYENLPDFQPHAEEGLKLMQSIPIQSNNREIGKYLIIAHNTIGNGETDRAKKIQSYETGRSIALTLVGNEIQTDPLSIDILSNLAHLTWNLGSQFSNSKVESDNARYAELRAEGEKLYADLILAQPDSPTQQKNIAFVLQDQANQLLKEGKKDDAIKRYSQCVSSWRAAAANNPNVTQYQRGLVLALKDYGIFMSQQSDFVTARASYEEAALVSEKMIGKRADRPANGLALLQVFNQLSEFEQYGKTNKDKGDPEAGARIREKAINLGRNLVATYPDAIDMSFELSKIMVNHARYDPIKLGSDLAGDLLREAINLMEGQRITSSRSLRSWHADNILHWYSDLDDFVKNKSTSKDLAVPPITEDRIRLLDSALEWMPFATASNSQERLMAIANRRSALLIDSNQPDQALILILETIELCKSSYSEKPYYYYLRAQFGGLYEALANIYQKMEQPGNELKARQKAIEIGRVPNYGREVFEDVLLPNLAPTSENLTKLRTVGEWGPKLKIFIIPCTVNGVKVPVQFYLHGGTLDKDFDPIADQARWLEEERGVIVPADVRDSLRKLAKIAYVTKVDFMELCTYALNYPIDESRTNKAAPAENETPPEKAVPESELSKALRLIDEQRTDFQNSTDPARYKLAGSFISASYFSILDKQFAEAAQLAMEGIEINSKISKNFYFIEVYEQEVILNSNLATALLFNGKYDKAMAVFRKYWMEPMQGRQFRDGIIEDFKNLRDKTIDHPNLSKAKKDLQIDNSTPFKLAESPTEELPLGIKNLFDEGNEKDFILDKIIQLLRDEIILNRYNKKIWNDQFVEDIANARYFKYWANYINE